VARNSRYVTLGEEHQGHVYLPFAQHPRSSMAVLVRSTEPPDRVVALTQDALAAIDSRVQGFFARTLREHTSVSLIPVRIAAGLSLVIAALGSLLAAIGLYALVSFLAAEREHELGVRLALGATPAALARLVVHDGLTLVAVGLGVGIPAALAGSTLARSLLYGVSPTDVPSIAGVVLAIVVIALIACAVPAIRVARLDPLVAMRRSA
jgi:putative ABC transport system permease protein